MSPENNYFTNWAKDVEISKDRSQITFKIELNAADHPFLNHHVFSGKCLLPAAMMVDLFLESCMILKDITTPYPLTVPQFEVLRAVHLDDGESVELTVETLVETNSRGEDQFRCVLLTDVKRNGKVVRNRVKVAKASLCLNQVILGIERPLPEAKNLIHYDYNMDKLAFYESSLTTHGPLFQTLTAKMAINGDKDYLQCDFDIGQMEDQFSAKTGLKFPVSPLGIDSLLQTTVAMSILGPMSGKHLFAKIPVQVNGFKMLKPFEPDVPYVAHAWIQKRSDQYLELLVQIEEKGKGVIGKIENVILQKAHLQKVEKPIFHEVAPMVA